MMVGKLVLQLVEMKAVRSVAKKVDWLENLWVGSQVVLTALMRVDK